MDITGISQAFKNHKIGYIGLSYQNRQGEIAKLRLNLGFSYENAQDRDLKTLSEGKGVDFIPSETYTQTDWLMAISELKNSVDRKAVKSVESQNRSKGALENVIYFTENKTLKYNTVTGELYIVALLDNKVILQNGVYPVVKSSGKTLAKEAIKKAYLRVGDIRNYKISMLKSNIKINGDTIEIEGIQGGQ